MGRARIESACLLPARREDCSQRIRIFQDDSRESIRLSVYFRPAAATVVVGSAPSQV